MQYRTVAVFDILGFREMVKTTPAAVLAHKFQRYIDDGLAQLTRPVMQPIRGTRLISDSQTRESWCLRYTFSDTIILISHDDTEQACFRLLLYAFRMLQYLNVNRFHARGGVAFGEMFVDIEHRLFLGKALIDAYELEQSQDWIGGAISENVEKAYPNVFGNPQVLENVFPLYDVPMKNGPIKQLRTINWRWNLVAQGGSRKLFRPTDNWAERRKIENTLRYLSFIRQSGRAYPQNKDCPLELHIAFVADGPPPPNSLPQYPHGDDL